MTRAHSLSRLKNSSDLGALYQTELDGLKIVEEIDPPGVQQALEGVLLLRQAERVDVAVYRGRVDAPAGDRDRRLVRPAQDQRRERLASVAARGRVRNYVALRVDEVERPDIDDAVADRRREEGEPRRRRRP